MSVGGGGGVAVADQWMAPRGFERRSANGEFVARVTPSNQEERRKAGEAVRRAECVVSKAGAAAGEVLWKVVLSNEVSPTDVMVSDDGRYVVTFDNWYGAGKGQDVLAFYDAAGQRKKYSLEAGGRWDRPGGDSHSAVDFVALVAGRRHPVPAGSGGSG